MKKLESTFINMVSVLVIVACISGGLMAFVNKMTEEPIKLQNRKSLSEGIKMVMAVSELKVSRSDTVKSKEMRSDFIVHHVSSPKGVPLGAAVESVVLGFGGDMKVLVGFNAKGKILGYTILQSSETPGLGQKADRWFQLGGKGCVVGRELDESKPLAVKNDGGDVDAITASTITSRAFLKAINQAYIAYLRCRINSNNEVPRKK